MNILFLTYQGDLAGSTFSIHYLSNGLAEHGHKVFVGCRKESALYQLAKNGNATPHAFNFNSKFDLKTMRKIRDLVHKEQISIINAQSSKDRYLSIFSRILYKLSVKLVHTRRQMPLMDAGKLQGWFYTRFTDRIIAVSNEVKRGLMQRGIPKDHIEVIYNGTPSGKYDNIDHTRVESLKEKYNIDGTEYIVGCVSRKKRQEQLLQSLKYIDIPVKVMLIGITEENIDSPLLEYIPEQHTVIFCGQVESELVLEYYKLFHVFVLPSNTEGLSQAILEAMALGSPVIATDAGGNSELIQHGENGLLFPDNDIRSLAQHISQLLTEEGTREKYISNGYKTAFETFSIENTISEYEKFFYTILNELN